MCVRKLEPHRRPASSTSSHDSGGGPGLNVVDPPGNLNIILDQWRRLQELDVLRHALGGSHEGHEVGHVPAVDFSDGLNTTVALSSVYRGIGIDAWKGGRAGLTRGWRG